MSDTFCLRAGIVMLCGLLVPMSPMAAQEQAEQTPQSEFGKDPVSLEQIVQLLQGDVSGYDILVEAHQRGLSFAVDSASIETLREAGADAILLNRISQFSALKEIVQWERAGGTAYKEGDYHAAIDACTELIDRCPRYVQILAQRSDCHLKLGDFEKAVQDLTRVCEYDPQDYESRFALAKALFRAGNLAQASFQLTSIVDELADPTHNVFREQGKVFERQGRYLDAAQAFRQAISKGPLRPVNLASLAMLLATSPVEGQQNAHEALELSTLALDQLRNQPESLPDEKVAVYSAHAAALAANGDFDGATTMLKEAGQEIDDPIYASHMSFYDRGEPLMLPEVAPSITPVDDVLTTIYEAMVVIPAGMRPSQGDEPVGVESFLLSTHEVTNWEWAMVMGETPPVYPDHAKDFVNLPDAERFIRHLNNRLGHNVTLFRLPTEDEWEFAVQAETDAPWYFGTEMASLSQHAWYQENSTDRVHQVEQLQPNPFGLFDVYGNVAEWCLPGRLRRREIDQGATTAAFAVHRGGNFANTPEYVRGDVPVKASPHERLRGVGFRLAATPSPRTDQLLARVRVQPEGLDRAIQELTQELRTTVSAGMSKAQQLNLIGLHYLRGISRYREGQFAEAMEDFEAVLLPAADEDGGLRGLALAQLAWIHATCPEVDFREPEQALEEAERALALTGRRKWFAFSVAAAASAGVGNFAKAITREEQAMALAPDEAKTSIRQRLAAFKEGTLPESSDLLFTFQTD